MVERKERKTFYFLFHYSRNCTMKLSLFIVYISVIARFCSAKTCCCKGNNDSGFFFNVCTDNLLFGVYISKSKKALARYYYVFLYVYWVCHHNIQHAITSHIFLMSYSPASVIYYIHRLKRTLFLTIHFF